MSRGKNLLKNTFVLSVGKFLPKLVSILTLPILTSMLTKREFGTYDFVLTLVAFLLPIATLQVNSAAFRFLIDCRNENNKKINIITNIFVITIPISFLVSTIMVFVWSDISIISRILISSYFFADILYFTISQICRGLSLNKEYSISSVMLSVINCLGIFILIKGYNFGLEGVIISLLIANIIAIIYLLIKSKVYKFIHIKSVNKEMVKELIAYSWPMIPNNLAVWILNLSDRIVITFILGIEYTAVYAAANKVPNLLAIAQSVFVMAWQENASLAVNDEDSKEYYSNIFSETLKLMVGVTVLLIGFTPIIFKLLIKGDYTAAYYQMPILIFGMFLSCMASFAGGIYIAKKETKKLGISTIYAAIINLVVDLSLIKFLGITAGSISTVLAFLFLYLYRMHDIHKKEKVEFVIKQQIWYFILILLMLLISFINIVSLNIFNIILGCLLFVIINKKQITRFLKKLKEIISNNYFARRRLEKSKIEAQKLYKMKSGCESITILSPNCIAGEIYNLLGLRFNSPTINCSFSKKIDFLKFCLHLKEYCEVEPTIIAHEGEYPVMEIKPKELDAIHIRWVHDNNDKIVLDNWNKRKKRIDYDNLYIICDYKYLTENEIEQLCKIKTKNTIVFTNYDMKIEHTYFVKSWKNKKGISKYNYKKLNGLYGFQDIFNFVDFLTKDNGD